MGQKEKDRKRKKWTETCLIKVIKITQKIKMLLKRNLTDDSCDEFTESKQGQESGNQWHIKEEQKLHLQYTNA